MISNKNFVSVPLSSIPKSPEYRGCNFAQPSPNGTGDTPTGHPLFPGDPTPRIFIRCNLVNCEPPAGSTLIECNLQIVRRGVPASLDTIVVDGVTVYSKQNTVFRVLGRINPDGTYQYLPTPLEFPE